MYHLNVNCSALDRSLAFYRDELGFEPVIRTTPATPQPGAAFGLAEVQWDAWIMAGADPQPVIDLLEWKVPTPTPATMPGGWKALIVAHPTHRGTMADPDGTTVEFEAGAQTRLAGARLACADTGASRGFYEEHFGFRPAPDVGSRTLTDGNGFTIALSPAPSPGDADPVPANGIGIFRMAMLTDAIDADHERLRRAGVTCLAPPSPLEMGPGIPPLRALFCLDPDGACVELIEPPA